MQTTDQAPAQRISSKKSNKKVYTYTGIVVFIALLGGYIFGTIKYKFSSTDEDTMGTKFYSWRMNGADGAMFKDKVGKFPEGKANAELTSFLKPYLSDKYSEHMPRDIANYLTLAFPNVDFVLLLRQQAVKQDSNHVDKTEGVEKSGEQLASDKRVTSFLENSSLPLYLEETSKSNVEAIIAAAHQEAGQRGAAFKASLMAALDFFIALAESQKSDNFLFSGLEPQTEGRQAVEGIISAMKEGEQPEVLESTLANSEDIKRFLKKNQLDRNSAEFPAELTTRFFGELKFGTLSPYFSFAYSRLAYTLYFLTLDAELSPALNPKDDEEQKFAKDSSELKYSQGFYRKRTMLLGELMAYAFAKNMSAELGESVVRSKGNLFYNFLFLPKLSTPNTEHLDQQLAVLTDALKERKAYVESL